MSWNISRHNDLYIAVVSYDSIEYIQEFTSPDEAQFWVDSMLCF